MQLALSCLILASAVLEGGNESATPIVSFLRDIKPILSEYCFACHGPDEKSRKARLRLDVREGLFRTRGDVTVVSPGDLKESELWRRLTSDDESQRMPPEQFGKRPSAAHAVRIRDWIISGAPFETHWAYVPPRRAPLPRVGSRAWPTNVIDQFVFERLEREQFSPSQAADRRTLARRLSFDLLGLPPGIDEVDAFCDDSAADAVDRLIDRTLASPHFGERMAVYWLDLVRYADTVGYHGDQEHNISPYRDWVIDAFNANMPFDRFTVAQLAGDLLPGATIDDRIASGYNRLLQTTHEGGAQDSEYRAIYAADRVRNLGSVWLSSTIGCAQCHDHKYDQFTMRDFYSLAAFFADLDELGAYRGPDTNPTKRPPEIQVLLPRDRALLTRLEQELLTLSAELQRAGADDYAACAELQAKIDDLQRQCGEIKGRARSTMVSSAVAPRTTRILPRGNWLDQSGPVVAPSTPAFLPGNVASSARLTRLDLSRWVVSPGNPLAAKTFVNRLWSLLFGAGLSRSLDDSGSQGEPPFHAELLDALALEFVGSGWDVKHIVRLMVSSRTYQQSSAGSSDLRDRDPENRFLARQATFRLPAEMIRDAALQASGLLTCEMSGPSVRPYQPDGYYQHLNFPQRVYRHDSDRQQWRRSVYMHWQRQFLHPMLAAFDAPRREDCTAQRPVSNTPQAALVMLNSPIFVEAARELATSILRESHGGDADRIDALFRRTLSRNADKQEHRLLVLHLDRQRRHYRADRNAADRLTSVGIAPRPSNVDVSELAACTSAARAILNLDEMITRD